MLTLAQETIDVARNPLIFLLRRAAIGDKQSLSQLNDRSQVAPLEAAFANSQSSRCGIRRPSVRSRFDLLLRKSP